MILQHTQPRDLAFLFLNGASDPAQMLSEGVRLIVGTPSQILVKLKLFAQLSARLYILGLFSLFFPNALGC